MALSLPSSPGFRLTKSKVLGDTSNKLTTPSCLSSHPRINCRTFAPTVYCNQTLFPVNCRREISSDFLGNAAGFFRRRRKPCRVKGPIKAQLGETAVEDEGDDAPDDEIEPAGLNEDSLKKLVQLGAGRWEGSFTQYDVTGAPLLEARTAVTATAHEGPGGAALHQTLHVQRGRPNPPESEEGIGEEGSWVSFELDPINLRSANSTQQIGFVEEGLALGMSHASADSIVKVVRAGAGVEEDCPDDNVPWGVKLPSRRPALVSECCLYAPDGNDRLRAFHVLDARGMIDTIGIFRERKRGDVRGAAQQEGSAVDNPLAALLGEWRGEGFTRRSPLYGGSTLSLPQTVSYSMEASGAFAQEITYHVAGSSRKMVSRAAVLGSVLRFDGGLQLTLLPGGISVACPSCVARGQAFYFECAWNLAPGQRRRLVRTHDSDGMVVSTTLVAEGKV